MSYKVDSAYIHLGSWNDESRAHPQMKWMENFTKTVIDGRRFADSAYSATSQGVTPDWTLQKSTGETVEGADAAWKAVAEIYAPFTSHVHDPSFCVTWETKKGWVMVGIADCWYTLPAPPLGGESRVKGYGGNEWDGRLSSAFKFDFVKDGSDVKLERTEIYSDPSTAMVQMLKRGMLKPEQLMG